MGEYIPSGKMQIEVQWVLLQLWSLSFSLETEEGNFDEMASSLKMRGKKVWSEERRERNGWIFIVRFWRFSIPLAIADSYCHYRHPIESRLQ